MGIKKGNKQERTIELSKLTLPNGTRFEPAISRDNFERLSHILNKLLNHTHSGNSTVKLSFENCVQHSG